ncbi:hypothetical protein [Paraburkholderia caballeronis]|uniref:Uncharacterized protein n=1 Tax=Paraburkholderia caballeronis TaxID=416943 RepID=A0A1H7FT62_9BURK|nr:hypothetical protein [Paraburkholderia caballeronis]PXW24845.1 hypothetical protein C7403_106166 [Paraburkholderia caballeronis]PXX00575.1 hypothetical protein C7407_106166 [Paraburkholderia caballeronis]RAJ98638.1 hypothetical protein C7409_106166 [Paraburkholderia caballeronis]TDV16540.1 hypothetical protein C7408_105159 [Paraburkholderia caballeronis]TDV18936.1 hypothetical protein C7406_104205 [Paraburkholderia caballeronis]
MSTPAAVTGTTGSAPDASADMATILRLQKLEQTIAKEIKAAGEEAAKDPTDPTMQLLVSQLTAQLTAIQGEITVLTGASSLHTTRPNVDSTKVDTRAIDVQSSRGHIAPQDPNGVTAPSESDKTRERRTRPFRFDLTGSQIDDEA